MLALHVARASPGHQNHHRLDTALNGQAVPYQTIVGRAFGELCVSGSCAGASNNAIITDINLAPLVSSGGANVAQYVTSFTLIKPVDNANISGILWHDVPNRGGRITINVAERNLGDVGVSSGWQGDNAGGTAVPACSSSLAPGCSFTNEWVKTPVAAGTTGFTSAESSTAAERRRNRST
jgi:hypothetical protein